MVGPDFYVLYHRHRLAFGGAVGCHSWWYGCEKDGRRIVPDGSGEA